ncbi:MAG: phosphatidylethanolamine-binding protein [gamma proteobacterium symbiont of Ctena orbiculata]|uniref:YbhB/YbcL family Raf kinase inhibitor-like protein n=1 Tax=Candidatus Thiodiazotropha taylori TaxID=2792791 RepID=A0A944QX87_9GAMM|nr:YbhB/YbcL family Raf kinase inhibitor-like protein [Candidatus Thiodiazotropha taylori]PVV10414.1 MAG: phosphatidylethanolamine-binding protein [gamma proteobacterium symbiont of Ctena orbiculata]MBT3028771.1 YbhB/YbcL family Raf kinase inhibitor-like protein [Candidatus Thiodiazotropha taylori]MBT3036846.1 YbhB/YbcL family Raf kinase inhibitor-like protein [Candidatus Thiodiazotropha taylori]MBV2136670.1 YbhB/YbcL family Raf kinase inhibitor-like protein [Candidatus Thiodiazotropha taylori]
MPMTLISNAFSDGGGIPMEYTCQGADISPQLAWDGVPENTRSLVLIVDDPDAPDPLAPKMVWVHWVLFNLPPETRELPKAISPADLPGATGEGINDWNRTGYGGPCPPIGRHRYFHKLYALDTLLEGLDNPTKAEVEQAMEGHVITEAVLMGTYLKSS